MQGHARGPSFSQLHDRVGAGALAAGIAFGLGGREIAAELSREWYNRMRASNAAIHASFREKHEAPPGVYTTPPVTPPDVGTPPPNDSRS